MSPRMFFEFRAQIDFLEVFQASDLRNRDSETWAKAMKRVRALAYVDEAWIDHTCIISVSTETSSARIADRRVRDVIAKATRIINSYTRKDKTP